MLQLAAQMWQLNTSLQHPARLYFHYDDQQPKKVNLPTRNKNKTSYKQQ